MGHGLAKVQLTEQDGVYGMHNEDKVRIIYALFILCHLFLKNLLPIGLRFYLGLCHDKFAAT